MKYIIKIHRILGTLFSILFLMWFLTGIVMIYHHYPSVSGSKALAYDCSVTPASHIPLDSLMSHIDCPADSIKEIQISLLPGMSLFTVKSAEDESLYDAVTGRRVNRLHKPSLDRIAAAWCSAPVMATDSLNEIDVWLIGAYPFKEYPVYKYSFDDDKRTELYLSSRTGRALQLTDSRTRLWAWLGAIPHWIYIKQLRATGRQPWTDVVLWLSGFGILMTFSGIIVGLRSMIIARRRGKLCPYRKPMFRWHHIGGLVFGLFVLTFIFSGFMSLQKVPASLVPYNDQYSAEQFGRGAEFIKPSGYTYDYRNLLTDSNVRQITMTVYGGVPVYKVQSRNDCCLLRANAMTRDTLIVDEALCHAMAQRSLSHGMSYSVSVVNDYEPGYSSVRASRKRPLPVFKVAVHDDYHSCFYIPPHDDRVTYSNDNSRMRGILYNTLHSLNCQFFYNHQSLREVVLWILMIGGTVVSFTGLVLGYRYIKRKSKKMK